MRQQIGEGGKLGVQGGQPLLCVQGDAVLCLVDGVKHCLQVVDKEGCCGCRRFHTEVAHHVENALVAVVADAGDDGYRELGYVLSQRQRVETGKVGRGAASSDDDHTVEVLIVNTVQCGDNALLYLFALHDGRE